jgi:hypothetical protein
LTAKSEAERRAAALTMTLEAERARWAELEAQANDTLGLMIS